MYKLLHYVIHWSW